MNLQDLLDDVIGQNIIEVKRKDKHTNAIEVMHVITNAISATEEERLEKLKKNIEKVNKKLCKLYKEKIQKRKINYNICKEKCLIPRSPQYNEFLKKLEDSSNPDIRYVFYTFDNQFFGDFLNIIKIKHKKKILTLLRKELRNNNKKRRKTLHKTKVLKRKENRHNVTLTKILPLSDFHGDLNKNIKPGDFKISQDTKILIAGDIAGSVDETNKFLREHFPNNQVFFVLGNHSHYSESEPYQEVVKKYKEKFKAPLIDETTGELGGIHGRRTKQYFLLHNNWYWTDVYTKTVAIMGAPFWTDYELGPLSQKENMDIARRYMNDFNNKFYLNDDGTTSTLDPEYYLKMHNESVQFVEKAYKTITDINPHAIIILLTHHPLTEECISENFKKSIFNASFTSNKKNWLLNMPQIKYIISGHVHQNVDYYLNLKTKQRYIINPYGYDWEKNDFTLDKSIYFGHIFNKGRVNENHKRPYSVRVRPDPKLVETFNNPIKIKKKVIKPVETKKKQRKIKYKCKLVFNRKPRKVLNYKAYVYLTGDTSDE